MALIAGKPVLEHLINLCRKHGHQRIALLTHYGQDIIENHFGDGSRFGVSLVYRQETEPRGTAGALYDALDAMADRFLVLYGDTLADVDLGQFEAWHDRHGAVVSLLAHPNDHPVDSDIVELGPDNRVLAIHRYPHDPDKALRNMVNAALYIMEKQAIGFSLEAKGLQDIAKHFLPRLIEQGGLVCGYVSCEYIKDMGTPERLDKIERDLLVGLPTRLSTSQMRQAVFIDRDGTLNREVEYVTSPDQLELLPGAGEAVRRLNRSGILAVCVTNQPVLARGDVTRSGLEAIHSELDKQLGACGAYLDRLYYCPHHPDSGYVGEVAELKMECLCRKPATGMIDEAVRDLNVDRRRSWIVGDSTADILAGARAGLRTILVHTGAAGGDQRYQVQPDYECANLEDAIAWILNGRARLAAQLMPGLLQMGKARLVLISGVSRSGKSTCARVLQDMLAASGRNAHVISLDGWLKPAADREEGAGITSRYALNEAAMAITALAGEPHATHFDFYRYDPVSRGPVRAGTRLVEPQDCLIVEGIPAALETSLAVSANFHVAVTVSTDTRRTRFLRDYAARGVPYELAINLLESRLLDEDLEVLASQIGADITIDGDLIE
jgi:histidinol-phosphate phosphatase family protein